MNYFQESRIRPVLSYNSFNVSSILVTRAFGNHHTQILLLASPTLDVPSHTFFLSIFPAFSPPPLPITTHIYLKASGVLATRTVQSSSQPTILSVFPACPPRRPTVITNHRFFLHPRKSLLAWPNYPINSFNVSCILAIRALWLLSILSCIPRILANRTI